MATERHYLPTNCCFVFSIRTGAIILAVLGIFGGGMNIISESYGLAVMAPDIEKYIDQYRSQVLEDFGKDLKKIFFLHDDVENLELNLVFLT